MSYEELYARWTKPLRDNPRSAKILRTVNAILTGLGYVSYPALIVWAALFSPELVLRLVVVPSIAFIVVSVFRHVQDSPRPYEMTKISPLIHKDTQGKSFPSRHIFSMGMIAMCYLYVCIPLGCILLLCMLVMAIIRVLGGVHFPKDVIAGALIAVVTGLIGFWVIPWA